MQDPATASVRLRVGGFEVDLRCGELRRDGQRIKVQERPFQILTALLEHPGQIVTREEIQQKLWPADTFVDFEHSINTAVKKLREALGDDAENPRFIETLPRRGYRLIATVDIIEANGAHVDAGSGGLAPVGEASPTPHAPQSKRWFFAGALVTLLAIVSLVLLLSLRRQPDTASRKAWVQITHFAEGATQPALSPDGRMIAFIRGPETFVTPGEIYVKMLPDGQPVQLTHDNAPKMAPAFSPDGSRIAYTATDRDFGWNSWVVPVMGGEPHELLPNAAALTWEDAQHVMFSEIKTSTYMGVAASTESRSGERKVYLPANMTGMAHRSWVSPDRRWVLISEMDQVGWRPCRMVPFDGSSNGQTVGPATARCTYAGWSPDGKTMYFSADGGDGYHIWRQRFPSGLPEQLTFGPTEEEGIAISPDGQTLVTSAGIRESTVWLHDQRGDRQVSGEGFASAPGLGFGVSSAHSTFSPDGKKLFYLVRTRGSRAWNAGELWMADLESGHGEAVLPGTSMCGFDISPDGELVAYSAPDAEGNFHMWVARLDRRSPPQQLNVSDSQSPSFGPKGEIYSTMHEGGEEFVMSVQADGKGARRLKTDSAAEVSAVSPHGDFWLSGYLPLNARPTQGGPPIRICGFCTAGWGPGGKFLYLRFRDIGEMGGGKTLVIALPSGKDIPILPQAGINSLKDAKSLPVVAQIDMTGMTSFVPGPNPAIYAYVRVKVQRNLFRISLN